MLAEVQLWAGAVNFPDFFAQQTIDWWTSQIQGLHSQLPFDGLWIDMHEPSNFCTGDVCQVPGNFYSLQFAGTPLYSSGSAQSMQLSLCLINLIRNGLNALRTHKLLAMKPHFKYGADASSAAAQMIPWIRTQTLTASSHVLAEQEHLRMQLL